MKRYQYTCRLLSDIIISSVTATEGFNPSLDYIPGAKFLGIAAGELYKEDNSATLDLFHNGKVRFGDAKPIIGGGIGYPVPFSWFFEKGRGLSEPPIYLHHKLKKEDFDHLTKEGKQLKQARSGYFTADGKYLKIDQEFAIRSAYNLEELRADEGKMFGYFSLPQGSIWTFVVDDDTALHADEIKTALIGKKRVGRSRSAEYGLVEIEFDRELPDTSEIIPGSSLTLIYAQSNLCFYDDFGRPTITPKINQLGIEGGEIIWDKSQIRSRLYQTWNRERHNRDADRMIIERGSVLAIKHNQNINTAMFSRGIGSHKSEGFGQVLFNPSFLLSSDYVLKLKLTREEMPSSVKDIKMTGHASSQDTVVLDYLTRRKTQKESVSDLDRGINEFVQKNGKIFNEISASQWGMVRAYAKHAANWASLETLLFHKELGALYRGQSESDWRKNGRREKLEIFLETKKNADRVSFTLKLAAEMAKRKTAKEVV